MGTAMGLSAGVVAMIVTVVIANLGNNIVAPVMPAIRDYFGSTAAQVSMVASGFGIGRLLTDIPSGYLTGRVSATKMFALGIVVSGGAAALAAASTSLEQLVFFRAAMGAGSAIMQTVSLVLLVQIAPPEHRGKALSFYTSSMLFGQAISPTIGGYVATIWDWRANFIFCALTPFVTFPLNLVATGRAKVPRPSSDPRGHATKGRGGLAPDRATANAASVNWPAIVTIHVSTFANFFSRHAMRSSLFPLYAGAVLALDPSTIGNILTLGSVLTIVINLPGGAAADRIGKKLLLVPGLLILGAGNLVILTGDSLLIFSIATVLVSMGVLANSMQSGLLADLTPESMLAKGIGVYRFTADCGMVIGPVVLGLVYDTFGFATACLAGAAVVLLGVVATLLFIPRWPAALPVRRRA